MEAAAEAQRGDAALEFFDAALDGAIAAAKDAKAANRLSVVRTAFSCLQDLLRFVESLSRWNAAVVLQQFQGPVGQGFAEPSWRAAAGYCIHVDCGHNGALQEVDLSCKLMVHIRGAGLKAIGRGP